MMTMIAIETSTSAMSVPMTSDGTRRRGRTTLGAIDWTRALMKSSTGESFTAARRDGSSRLVCGRARGTALCASGAPSLSTQTRSSSASGSGSAATSAGAGSGGGEPSASGSFSVPPGSAPTDTLVPLSRIAVEPHSSTGPQASTMCRARASALNMRSFLAATLSSVLHELAGALVAGARIDGEPLGQHPVELARQARHLLRHRRDRLRVHVVGARGERGGDEQLLAGQHLVEDDGDRVEVGARRRACSLLRLLGRHVADLALHR